MFNVNDYVIYGTTGVCKITDIKKENFVGNAETDYYILHPVYSGKTTIMTPVSNKKILMRILSTKQEINTLIEKIPSMKSSWITDDRLRMQKFKEALHTGNCEEWIKLIKEIHLKRKERTDSGKKLRQSDEDIVKSAERLLYEEFSVSLQIPIEEVKPYIMSHIAQ